MQNLTKKYPDSQLKFELPINVYDKNIVLSIQIPKELQLRHEYPGNPHFMQFGNKDILITIAHQTGGKFQSNQSLDKIVKAMQAKSQITILQNEDHNYPGYSEGYRIVKLYDTQKNTTDIVYIYAASGPYDSASILYSMRLHGNDPVGTVMQKAKEAFKGNIKIIDKDSGH